MARYYLRYGTVDVLDGSEQLVTLYGTSRVRKLILLGTPNMGSASSLHAFLIGEPIVFKRIPQEVLATLPSGYQLFPHPLVTWLVDTAGDAARRRPVRRRDLAALSLVDLRSEGRGAAARARGRPTPTRTSRRYAAISTTG